MAKPRTAIAVAGFNRPHYFRPTIASIFANSQLKSCDLWFFLDGGENSTQSAYRQIVDEELANASFVPQSIRFVERPTNFGCGRNLIGVRHTLFDEEEYERVFLFEDDMVISEHYIALGERLLDWSESRFSDIGVVQPFSTCCLPVDEKVCRVAEVNVGSSHWWGYLMPRATWNAIRDNLFEYEERFLRPIDDYESRDNLGIRQWAVGKLGEALRPLSDPYDVFRGKERFPDCWDFLGFYGGPFYTSQDSMTGLALTLAGLQKLNTTVNRGLPIGVEGLHSTVGHFRRRRYDEIELHNFPSDATRAEFRVHDPWETLLKPYMRADEVEAIRLLIHQRRPSRVLEFGAGGSTVTFAREPSIKQWWSLEHSLDCVNKVLSAVGVGKDSNITMVACPEDKVLERTDQLLPLGFSMYFVDGFNRCAILRRLRAHLESAPGFVVLHDASRPQYRDAIECFPKREVLSPGNGKHQGLLLLEV